MSDRENFLSRWSQRKREAGKADPETAAVNQPPAEIADEAETGETAEEFDLSTLPSIEELTQHTDISVFLRKGVPESLRNAALRKSWALDPAIRNYVNPALDYAYDWNTPGGVPGNSELGAGMDVARLVSQIMGDRESVVESAPAAETENEVAGVSGPLPDESAMQKSTPDLPVDAVRLGDDSGLMKQTPINGDEGEGHANAPDADDAAAPQQSVRRHGSAKPVV